MFRARAELGSDDAEQQTAAGSFFPLDGDPARALAAFQAALKLDPQYTEARRQLQILVGAALQSCLPALNATLRGRDVLHHGALFSQANRQIRRIYFLHSLL